MTNAVTWLLYSEEVAELPDVGDLAEFDESIDKSTKLDSNRVVNGNLEINADLDLNGYTMTVEGDVVHKGGTIYFNEGLLRIKGNYVQPASSSGGFYK